MRRLLFAAALAASGVGVIGCDGGKPVVKSVQAPEADPIAEAKAMLTNYSKGAPVTSEAESFPDLVSRVKAKDAAKGAILEKGFKEILANKSGAKAKADELLKKL